MGLSTARNLISRSAKIFLSQTTINPESLTLFSSRNHSIKIIDMNRKGTIVTVQQERNGLTLYRHPDDLKPLKSRPNNPEEGMHSYRIDQITPKRVMYAYRTQISNGQKKSNTTMTATAKV